MLAIDTTVRARQSILGLGIHWLSRRCYQEFSKPFLPSHGGASQHSSDWSTFGERFKTIHVAALPEAGALRAHDLTSTEILWPKAGEFCNRPLFERHQAHS